MPGDSSKSTARHRAEYIGRIQRVVDYIEVHLAEELTLEQLAKVACFSPFHFHRVFRAITGEPLYQFILRLRLEKAANQLAGNPGQSVTAIALDCGFGSSAAFARAFRAAFGKSATQWREDQSKIRKPIRKAGEDAAGGSAYRDAHDAEGSEHGASGDSPWRITMQSTQSMKEAQSVKVETLAPMTVAYVRHVGPYAGNAEVFGRLFGMLMPWAGARGFLGPQAKILIVYHDNPDITDQDKLRTSVCVTVPPGTAAEGEVGIMEVAGGKYALARFELDTSEYGAAWGWVYGKWLPESGFQPDDRPPFELCLNDPDQHPQHKHVIDICVPVRPL